MGQYKGVSIPDRLVGIINYMRPLEETREALTVLGQQWDLLSILGKMSNTGTDMTKTREGFKHLTSDLLGSLGNETLKKSLLSIASKAQVTVDIVIRNLFERTADIGFLATDDDLRKFLQKAEGYSAEGIRSRFAEYVAKYSVYENILLLDPQGNLCCQLRTDNPLTVSQDALLQEAISTNAAYVEKFGWSDLNPQANKSLIYSFRVTESNQPKSPVIGVLCLVFRFENELEGIFKNLITEGDWTVLSLLDATGAVIASSDQSQVPLGSQIKFNPDAEFTVTRFGGRLYLSRTCRTKGYQGYMGLGWYGHAMLPLELAFESKDGEQTESVDPAILDALMSSPRLFSEELRKIPQDAQQIQSELDRTVWNGSVRMREPNKESEKSNERKVLLWEISSTGSRTKAVFEDSIGALRRTVISSILADAEFISSLSIDIMDRNLYERANDCRWWALTRAFRSALSEGTIPADERSQLTDILKVINGLYTVYTNLILFDRQGVVIATSNPAMNQIVGRRISEPFITETISATGHDRYVVSAFDKTPLYNGEHTYIYSAPIRHFVNEHEIVGGIAIVFDSKPQFKAMLDDSLPRNEKGEIPEGCFSVFANRQRKIIATNSPTEMIGETLSLPEDLFQLKCGATTSRILEYRQRYFAVGVCVSKGYREYKGSDDLYKNDVVSLVFIPLGNASTQTQRRPAAKSRSFHLDHQNRIPGKEYKEIATFMVGESWLGFESHHLVEAISSEFITPLPGAPDALAGTVMYQNQAIGVLKPHKAMGAHDSSVTDCIVVIFRFKDRLMGMLVDSLGEIPEVAAEKIHRDPSVGVRTSGYIEGIVSTQASGEKANSLLILLNPTKFVESLVTSVDASGQSIIAELKRLGATNDLTSEADEDAHSLGVFNSLKGS